MTILVFGSSGQVGSELAKLEGMTCLSRVQADLTQPETCLAAIERLRPKAVINAAAYTAVDRAETETALAMQINAEAPGQIALRCAEMAVPFVHISTDYVFDGSGNAPWQPEDATAPVNAYGMSKAVGEKAVREAGGRHAILRTSWVHAATGANFVKTMLRLGQERDALSIVADQIGGPTSAKSIAKACSVIAGRLTEDHTASGTYHFSGAPDCSWADFAEEIFRQARINCTVRRIATADYPTPAKRPRNSRLDCRTTKAIFGLDRPDWRADLKNILTELEAAQ